MESNGRAEGPADPDGVRAYALARLGAVIVAIFLACTSPAASTAHVVALIAVVSVYELLSGLALLRGTSRRVAEAALLIDVVSFGALMAMTGGADSHLRFFTPVVLVVVALHFRPWQVAWTAAGLAAGVALSGVPDLQRGEGDAPLQVVETLVLLLFATLTYVLLATARLRVSDGIQAASDERRELLKAVLDTEAADRRRLTRDLHEGPLQRMLALRQDLEEAREGDADALELGEEGVVHAIEELREVIAGLHPVALDHGGLSAALRALADRAATEGDLASAVHVAKGVDGLRDTVIVSVTRELLGNVVAHAHATSFELQLMRPAEGLLVLSVRDDGIGFDPAAQAEGALGLAAMRERVSAIGGAVELEAAPGAGTHVRVRLPL